jgi:hypothetical protein
MVEEDRSKINAELKAIDSRYRREVAVVDARPKVETAAFIFWAVLDLVLILTFVFGVLLYITSGAFADARQSVSLLHNAASLHAGSERVAPQPLENSSAQSVSLVTGKYDLFVKLTNPNPDWYATFDYAFVFDGGETAPLAGFMNPDESRTLAYLGVSSSRRPSAVRMVMTNFIWHRVDPHVIPDPELFVAERANITVEQATYATDLVIGTDQVARSQITLQNRTAYAYWSPEFLVKLMRGSTVVSLTKITVPEFKAGETRQVEVRWFGEAPPSGTISLEPIIPYFAGGVYMNPDDETGLDVRE